MIQDFSDCPTCIVVLSTKNHQHVQVRGMCIIWVSSRSEFLVGWKLQPLTSEFSSMSEIQITR